MTLVTGRNSDTPFAKGRVHVVIIIIMNNITAKQCIITH